MFCCAFFLIFLFSDYFLSFCFILLHAPLFCSIALFCAQFSVLFFFCTVQLIVLQLLTVSFGINLSHSVTFCFILPAYIPPPATFPPPTVYTNESISGPPPGSELQSEEYDLEKQVHRSQLQNTVLSGKSNRSQNRLAIYQEPCQKGNVLLPVWHPT